MAEKSDRVTDKDVYLNRRRFIQAAVMAGTATATTLQASRVKPLAGGYRLAAENPVTVIVGRR